MRALPMSDKEEERLAEFSTYQILDTTRDPQLDELTALAAKLFKVPIVIITILDKNRQWFKSEYGLGVRETPRNISFCQYTIMNEEEVFEVEDATLDERFKENPMVLNNPNIRFYCGAPLVNKNGFVLGSLGLIDTKPRRILPDERKGLKLLAKQVVDHFELHREKILLEHKKEQLEKIVEDRTRELQQKLRLIEARDKKLNALNNELKTFIYKASHDLRGPIKTMMGLTELALKELGEETLKAYLALLYNTENKMDQSLDALLEIVEVKSVIPECVTLNPGKLIQEIFSKVKEVNKNKNLNFEFQDFYQNDITTDQYLLKLAIYELVKNGVVFNHHDLIKISIQLFKSDNKVQLEIRDNGSGIPENEIDRIFDMFYKSRSIGSGLGLYLAKNAIERLGGDIKVESQKIKGSTFTITLPDGSEEVNS